MYPRITLPAMLKVKEAAEAFRVGAGTIRKAVQTGQLKGYSPNGHAILVKATEVQEWIDSLPYNTRIGRKAARTDKETKCYKEAAET